MKKILLIGCLLCANLQAQVYNFESAATGSSGISTATARQNTGWTSNGTTAQDTSATYYIINGKYQRQIWVDTDNDSIINAPHALYPLIYKDATSSLWFVDSTGIMSAQAVAIVHPTGYITIGGTNALNRPAGGNAVYVGPGFNFAGIGSQAGLGAYFNSNTTGRWQGIATVRAGAVTADTQLVVRNDWNSTLDSTFMVFANGSAYVGGNNIYFGANRIRSVTGDTAFVFYAGSTQAFAILADGSTADLVAGTPPSFRGIPPMEYRILLWVIAALLFVLVAWRVFELAAKIKLNHYDTHVERA